jgi:cyanophycinase
MHRARRTALRAAALLAFACAGAADPAPKGSLLMVGGGPRPPALMERFVELAGGAERARIVVLPMASSEAEAGGNEQVEEFAALGARARSLNLSREQASREESAGALDQATGIWFGGGDQSRLMAAIDGTPVEAAILARYRDGAVLGGTSAGAAVMSDPMITGDERRPGGDRKDLDNAFLTIERENVVTGPGLGLLPGVIVDQHFVRRKRHNRLLSLVLEHALIGLGIDESTAVEVGPDGVWRALGDGAAIVYDARDARVTAVGAYRLGASDVRLHVLTAGAAFDPASRRVTLPDAR